jgi:hypothetical protein
VVSLPYSKRPAGLIGVFKSCWRLVMTDGGMAEECWFGAEEDTGVCGRVAGMVVAGDPFFPPTKRAVVTAPVTAPTAAAAIRVTLDMAERGIKKRADGKNDKFVW